MKQFRCPNCRADHFEAVHPNACVTVAAEIDEDGCIQWGETEIIDSGGCRFECVACNFTIPATTDDEILTWIAEHGVEDPDSV